ncbi:unnamed protein product [Prunus armeniaca]
MGNSSSDEPIEENPPNFNEGRNRRPLVWMEDYETGEGLSEEYDVAHFVMIVAADAELPAGGKKIGVKWVYKTKLNENGEVDKYKARLIAKGYSQQHGIDYTEVFAPVARLDTICLVIALAAQRQWTIYQLDVKSAFLHGELNEEVFVEQPQGYVRKGNEHKVYRLKKALYGLKQAPRAWYSCIKAYFMKEGFERCHYEHTLFTKTAKEGKILIVSLYVDDLIFTGNDESMFAEFKRSMMLEFDMTDLGKMRYFLGIEVMQRTDGIFISQKKYALEVLEKFGMNKSNLVLNPIVSSCKLLRDEDGVKVDSTIYKQIVGSLMYLTATRLDMMFVRSNCFGVFYKKGGKGELNVYTDSDYAGDQEDRKSTLGYIFLFSSGDVSWSSKKQPIVTLSTTEAEFIAAASCACQAGTVEMVHCNSQEQIADVMTKPLKLDAFVKLRSYSL